jgi:hypothetical protein
VEGSTGLREGNASDASWPGHAIDLRLDVHDPGSHDPRAYEPKGIDVSFEATDLLRGRVVQRVVQHRPSEVLVEFEGGARLFLDAAGPVELSITGV